jgi:hypothetical protein
VRILRSWSGNFPAESTVENEDKSSDNSAENAAGNSSENLSLQVNSHESLLFWFIFNNQFFMFMPKCILKNILTCWVILYMYITLIYTIFFSNVNQSIETKYRPQDIFPTLYHNQITNKNNQITNKNTK